MKQLVFLDGTPGLDSQSRENFDTLKRKFNCMIFDNLYEKPEKLVAMKFLKPEFIHVNTTNTFKEKNDHLLEHFKIAEHIPEGVIFANEMTAMAFLGLARELKEKGTKFYYLDLFERTGMYEISWI